MEPLDEDTIRQSFVNCSKGEAKRLSMPAKLADTQWANLDFLGWRDPRATDNAYLVLRRDDEVVGLAMRVASQSRSHLKQSICALCHTVQGSADVGLFTARRIGAAGKHGNTVGTYICADLGCSLYLRGLRRTITPQPAETATTEERIDRMRDNLDRFVAEVLTDNVKSTAG